MVSGESFISSLTNASANEKFQSLLNSVNGYEEFILNGDGIIISSNLESVTITGYEEWEVIGKHISIFYSRKDIDLALPELDLLKAKAGGKHISSGFRLKKKGQPFFARMKYSCFSNDHAAPGYKVVLFDTTHRALYAVGTRKMKEEYLSLFNNSFIGIFKFRLKDFGFIMLNEKALEIVRKERNQLKLNSLFYHEVDFSNFIDLLSTEKLINNFEFRLNVIGIERYVSISCRLFSYRGFAEGIISDTTEKRNHIQQIESLHYELDNFLYHASHDIRAPLPTIQGLINLIRRDDDHANILLYADKISAQVRQMDSILKDLSEIAFNNAQPVQIEHIHLKGLIQGIIEAYQQQYPFVKTITEINETQILFSDEKRVTVIFQHLISNAFKYSRFNIHKPFLRIKVNVSLMNAIVQVEDNGCGIEQKYINDIFKLFFKIDSRGKGSGLGLYVVEMMIKKLKGKIDVTSKINVGTCVSFTIPNQQKPF